MSAAPTDAGIAVLRHATDEGAGWRVYYCSHDGDPTCEALVASGHMARGPTINDGEDRYYYATETGLAAALRAIKEERRQHCEVGWLCSTNSFYGRHTKLIYATTRSKARYRYALHLSDTGESVGWWLTRIDVRRA